MTAEEIHGFKVERLEEGIAKLTAAVEKFGEHNAKMAAEIGLLRRDYSQIPTLSAKIEAVHAEANKEINEIEKTLSAQKVWIHLLSTGVIAALAGLAAALFKLVIR